MMMPEAPYRPGGRVEWNSISDKWLPATVDRVDVGDLVVIVLDGKGQILAHPDRLRPLGSPTESARHEIEGMTAVPDTSEPWAARLAGPHPPHISRVAGALLTWTSSRSQAYMVAYTLADAGLLAGDSPTQMLREFSAATGGDDRPYAEWAKLRLDLLREEVAEFVEALESGDVAAIAREGADVEYVVHGTMVRLGVDLDAAFREVHRANMSKAGPDGMFLIREDGKILKPDGFTPPDMSCAVADAAESRA